MANSYEFTQLLEKRKSKAAAELSQWTALPYSYDLDWNIINQQPPDREWSIDDNPLLLSQKHMIVVFKGALTETVPFSAKTHACPPDKKKITAIGSVSLPFIKHEALIRLII